jgi:hypothetical protein
MQKRNSAKPSAAVRMALATLSAAALVGLTGCHAAIVPPAELVPKADVHAATDRSSMSGLMVDEAFVLGAYKVTEVDRDWMQHESSKTETFDGIHSTAGYVYTLVGGPAPVQGTCAWASGKGGVSIMGVAVSKASNVLTCECVSDGESSVMRLTDGGTLEYAGEFMVDGEAMKVSPVSETEGTYMKKTPPGYRIDGEAGVLGAVEVIHPGRVWLDQGLGAEKKGTLSCAMTGLMLMWGAKEHKM